MPPSKKSPSAAPSRTPTIIVCPSRSALGDADVPEGCMAVHPDFISKSIERKTLQRPENYPIREPAAAAASATSPPAAATSSSSAPQYSDDEDGGSSSSATPLFAKYAVQRPTTVAGNKNTHLTEELCVLLKYLAIQKDRDQFDTRYVSLMRAVAVVRAWPTEITQHNWSEQRTLLAREHYLGSGKGGGKSSSLAYMADILGGAAANSGEGHIRLLSNLRQDAQMTVLLQLKTVQGMGAATAHKVYGCAWVEIGRYADPQICG